MSELARDFSFSGCGHEWLNSAYLCLSGLVEGLRSNDGKVRVDIRGAETPQFLVSRAGLKSEMQAVVDASGLPFATMYMDKAVLDEQQASYIGTLLRILPVNAAGTFWSVPKRLRERKPEAIGGKSERRIQQGEDANKGN